MTIVMFEGVGLFGGTFVKWMKKYIFFSLKVKLLNKEMIFRFLYNDRRLKINGLLIIKRKVVIKF